jgi:poly-beta-1,6-N-acetyl-D-glucosamine synthase
MKIIFWLSIIFIVYTYAGYPILLFIWSKLNPTKVDKAELTSLPFVSIIISARNEENSIANRLDNLLETKYDVDQMEIIVVSDGSTDGTSNIVKEYIGDRRKVQTTRVSNKISIQLIELEESRGKATALNAGYEVARGEYIVFTDTRQAFETNAIRKLIANFHDTKVGCVSGELVFYKESGSKIEAEIGYYWNLEKKIRKMESKTGSVVGATGAIYAIRRHLYTSLPKGLILDDVYIPMKIVCQGYRAVFESDAIAYDRMSDDITKEKSRKVRTLLGNYQLLKAMPELLSPFKNPLYLRFLSHKIFRLFVPFFVASLFISSYVIEGTLYTATFYLIATVLILPIFDKALSNVPILNKVVKLTMTFVTLNYFALLAFLYLFRSEKEKVW